MNRKHNTNGEKYQGWVTLNRRQLSQVEGGDVPTTQMSLNYEEIKVTYNRSRSTPKLLESVSNGTVYPA